MTTYYTLKREGNGATVVVPIKAKRVEVRALCDDGSHRTFALVSGDLTPSDSSPLCWQNARDAERAAVAVREKMEQFLRDQLEAVMGPSKKRKKT